MEQNIKVFIIQYAQLYFNVKEGVAQESIKSHYFKCHKNITNIDRSKDIYEYKYMAQFPGPTICKLFRLGVIKKYSWNTYRPQ